MSLQNDPLMDYELTECSVCSPKPGSPPLCPSCLRNRQVISQLKQGYKREYKARELYKKENRKLTIVLCLIIAFLFIWAGFSATH